jgi:hypothetical protein
MTILLARFRSVVPALRSEHPAAADLERFVARSSYLRGLVRLRDSRINIGGLVGCSSGLTDPFCIVE